MDEIREELRAIRKLVESNTSTCLKILAYFEQLSDLYEQLRAEHAKNHGDSILPIQLRRKLDK